MFLTTEEQKLFDAYVAILDEKYPGWHTKIDLKRLDMISARDCIIGQITGYWTMDFHHELFGEACKNSYSNTDPCANELYEVHWEALIRERNFGHSDLTARSASV